VGNTVEKLNTILFICYLATLVKLVYNKPRSSFIEISLAYIGFNVQS